MISMPKVWKDYREYKDHIFSLPIENHSEVLYNTLLNLERPELLQLDRVTPAIRMEDFGSGGTLRDSSNISNYINETIEEKVIKKYFNQDGANVSYFGIYPSQVQEQTTFWLKQNDIIELGSDVDVLFEVCRITANQIFVTLLKKLSVLGGSYFQELSKNRAGETNTELYLQTRKHLFERFQAESKKIDMIWAQYEEAINNLTFQYSLHKYVQMELTKLETK
jgi:hypothetical protein